MNKEKIVEILNAWNFWKDDLNTGFPREKYLEKLLKFISADKVISIVGVRRSGKSTLIRQLGKNLIEQGIKKDNILIVNLEEPEFEGADLKLLTDIYKAYLEIIQPQGKPYIFLDEIQEIEKWEKFVRALNEKKEAHITVTGSSSKLLSEELATVLSGRQIYFKILPFDFKEFLNFHNLKIATLKEILLNSDRIRPLFREYLLWGGFPEIILNKDEEFKRRVLVSYYEDIIGRDIVKRFRVKKIDKLKFLAHFYLTNISSSISFNKISRFISLPVETIRRFSFYIETANLVFFVKRFSFTLKEQENSPRKVYSIDTGLSNSVGFRFSQNYGRLAENIVALSLQRIALANPFMEVYYWKDRHSAKEIDFLIKEKAEIGSLIQVSWDIEDFDTKEREVGSLLKGLNEFGLKKGLIITGDYEGEEKITGKTIKYLPLWKWLLLENSRV